MNIIELKTFLKVVECHSISLAAKQLHSSQPTVSRRIKKLEQELGSQLFVNTLQGVELTQKGKAFVPYIRQIFTIYNEMMKTEHNSKKIQPQLTINIGLIPYVSISLFTDFINYMHSQKTHYFITNKIAPGKELIPNLANGNFDLVIMPSNGTCPNHLFSIPLWKERVLPVVSIQHPLAKQDKPISLAELTEYDAVMLSTDSVLRQMFNVLATQKGVATKTISEVNNIYTNIKTVEAGSSWCLVYERLLNENLAVVELHDFTMEIEFHAFYLKKRSDERLIWEFIEHFKGWLNNSPDLTNFFLKTNSLAMQKKL